MPAKLAKPMELTGNTLPVYRVQVSTCHRYDAAARRRGRASSRAQLRGGCNSRPSAEAGLEVGCRGILLLPAVLIAIPLAGDGAALRRTVDYGGLRSTTLRGGGCARLACTPAAARGRLRSAGVAIGITATAQFCGRASVARPAGSESAAVAAAGDIAVAEPIDSARGDGTILSAAATACSATAAFATTAAHPTLNSTSISSSSSSSSS